MAWNQIRSRLSPKFASRKKSRRISRRRFRMELLESRRLLAVFTVTTSLDTVDASDGELSLREAILQSDANSEPDTILFDAALTATAPVTIHTNASLEILSSLTIDGPGADRLTIHGGHGADNEFNTSDGFNVFVIDDGNDNFQSVVEIRGMTITGGDTRGNVINSGGAIAARENLTLRSVHLLRNAGNVGGGMVSGWPTIDSVVSVIDSTVSENVAALGGGIHHIGTILIHNSTIADNHAVSPLNGRAGGLSVQGTLQIDHSTITGNTSESTAGGIQWSGIVDEFVTVNHSIVSGNSAPDSPNMHDAAISNDNGVFGRFQGDYNVIGAGFRTPGTNTIISDEPLLGPLADNGGSIPTNALFGGSPAIDAGSPVIDEATLPFDQRGVGFPRIRDGNADGSRLIDIGAFEFQSSPNHQPDFMLGPNPRVLEDGGPVAIPNFASFDPGDPSEANQTVLEYRISDLQRPDLFSVPPTIDTAGTLSFAPKNDAFGITTLSVVVQDSGGTADGGVDTSEMQQFTLTIKPVNDAPSFVADTPPTVVAAAGAGAQSIENFIRSVDFGASNESDQAVVGYSVSVTDVQGNSELFFESGPMIDSSGNLTFTVRDEILQGSATLEIAVQDDGGTLDGGQDTSTSQNVTIQVVPTDFGDAPGRYPVTRAQNGAQHVMGELRLGGDVDGEIDGKASEAADGDSGDDGVKQIASLLRVVDVATTASFEVIVSDHGRLNAWIDFTNDGDWDDPGEQIATGVSVRQGSNTLSFTVPGNAVVGEVVARFRLSSLVSLSPTGFARDGEVEDYVHRVLDRSDNPEVVVETIKNWTSITLRDEQIVVRDFSVDLFGAPIQDVSRMRVMGTDSHDTIALDPASLSIPGHITIDSGSGADRLMLLGDDGDLDLTSDESITIIGISTIDLGDHHTNSLFVSADAARQHATEHDHLLVVGGDGDQIHFDNPRDWKMGPSSIANGVFLRSAVHTGDGEERIDLDLPLPWHNLLWANDVNSSGNITPLDALLVINDLVREQIYNPSMNELLHPVALGRFSGYFVDTNGDGRLTPRDALSVINEIARTETGIQSEAELATSALTLPNSDSLGAVHLYQTQRASMLELSKFESQAGFVKELRMEELQTAIDRSIAELEFGPDERWAHQSDTESADAYRSPARPISDAADAMDLRLEASEIKAFGQDLSAVKLITTELGD